MKILLVAAAYERVGSSWLKNCAPGLVPSAYTVPLHLATVAALTPREHDVQIWDEPAQGPIDDSAAFHDTYDLVGVTGYSNHLPRAREIARLFRERGITVVIGGAGVSAEPDNCRDDFDVCFIGEAEATWPRFLEEFKTGTHGAEYRTENGADISVSPPPRWDSIAHLMASNYQTGGIQTNRGCPYTCEFCNVWMVFGRKMRTKAIDQVIQELITLERLGMERIIFATDNFVGDPRYAKELLRALIPVNNSFEHPIRFVTELTLTISRDEELLRLLADANFQGLFIGIESPNIDSLKETRKKHNIRGGIVEQCKLISSYGMYIMGSMIVGFDNDTPAIFDEQFAFLQEACITVPRLNVLLAGRGTELYDRMLREGRLLDVKRSFEAMSAAVPGDSFVSNIIPTNMTRAQLYAGYGELAQKVFDWHNFEQRVIGFIDNIQYVRDVRPDERVLQRVAAMRSALHRSPNVDVAVAERLLDYAAERVSPLLGTIAFLVTLQAVEASRMPALAEAVARHVDMEESLEKTRPAQIMLEPKRDKTPALRVL